MKKTVIASSVLAIVMVGSGLTALIHSNETTAAPIAMESPQPGAAPTAAQPPRPEAAPPTSKRPPQQDGKCGSADPAPKPEKAGNNISETVQGAYTVIISGGFDTDPQDHGRPVALIAAALGVPTEVFREAFSGVTPAGLGRGPTAEEAQSNKAALMKVLAPYNIKNDQLDEVSDYYRYNGKNGGIWKRTLATAIPIIKNGVVTGITVTNPGSGYTSAPTVTIKGPNGTVTAKATVVFTKDFKTNGSLSSITLD